LEVLAGSEIRNSAARVAARIDFVIVSFRGKVVLLTEVKSWIEMWSRLIAIRSAALIVLANKPRTKASMGASTLTYLRSGRLTRQRREARTEKAFPESAKTAYPQLPGNGVRWEERVNSASGERSPLRFRRFVNDL